MSDKDVKRTDIRSVCRYLELALNGSDLSSYDSEDRDYIERAIERLREAIGD